MQDDAVRTECQISAARGSFLADSIRMTNRSNVYSELTRKQRSTILQLLADQTPDLLYTEPIRCLIDAMRQNGIERIFYTQCLVFWGLICCYTFFVFAAVSLPAHMQETVEAEMFSLSHAADYPVLWAGRRERSCLDALSLARRGTCMRVCFLQTPVPVVIRRADTRSTHPLPCPLTAAASPRSNANIRHFAVP